MATPSRKIFISYRRQDNPEFVERIRDWFIRPYGRDNVFMDFDTIPPMVKFADFIRKEIEACDVMLVIIGPRWIELLREKAANFEEDFVRIEVGLALQLGKPIMPICIMDAQLPKPTELPADLSSLLAYNTASLHPGRDFLDNIERILEAINNAFPKPRRGANVLKTLSLAIKIGAPIVLVSQAIIATNKGDLEYAVQMYTAAIGLESSNAMLYINRGNLYYKTGDFEKALDDFDKAISLNPQFESAWINRGLVHFVNDNYQSALSDFSQAQVINPSSKAPIGGLAITLYKKGRKEEAKSQWEKLAGLDQQYLDPDWVGTELDWKQPHIDAARQLIAELPPP